MAQKTDATVVVGGKGASVGTEGRSHLRARVARSVVLGRTTSASSHLTRHLSVPNHQWPIFKHNPAVELYVELP